MAPAYRRIQLWLALIVSLSGLVAMGAIAWKPLALGWTMAPAATRAVTAPPAIAPLTPTPVATATPAPTAALTLWPSPSPAPPASPAPQPTPDAQERTARVPILMYHYVSDPPPGADSYRLDLSVPPSRFEAQLAYLQQAGYTSITLEDLVIYLTTGRPLPPKPIILTFDDGYVDNFVYAFPLLRQYHFRGTFFVITQFLDEQTGAYMSWEQAQLMEANGMDVEAHGITHDEMKGQPAARQQEQLEDTRATIEAHLHKPVRFFAYTFGHYDQRTIGALRAAGYWAAVTTQGGAVHSSGDLLELARVRIHGEDGLDKFVGTLQYYEP